MDSQQSTPTSPEPKSTPEPSPDSSPAIPQVFIKEEEAIARIKKAGLPSGFGLRPMARPRGYFEDW